VSTRLALASLAVDQPMGQQVYEQQLIHRAPSELGDGWVVDNVQVRTMRSHLNGSARVPSRLLAQSSPSLRRAAGRLLYRGHDVVHRLDLRLPPAPDPEILTVHDVVGWRFPDEATPPADAGDTARRAVTVVCPSQFSADEVHAVLGVETPVAIHNGVDGRFFAGQAMDEEGLAGLGIRRPFVLHAGGCTLRKNLTGLAGAWAKLHPSRLDSSLVLMGPTDERRNRLFDPLPGTVRLGRVDDITALGVLAAASAVVVPSLYEGFGLPALEGMAVGVPVVAARRSSLPEVCGSDALLVEPDGNGLAEGLEAALSESHEIAAMVERGRERARQFTWEASLALHADIWRSVVD
jgi:glycosyltransferase involved in cell wall biosynthesis